MQAFDTDTAGTPRRFNILPATCFIVWLSACGSGVDGSALHTDTEDGGRTVTVEDASRRSNARSPESSRAMPDAPTKVTADQDASLRSSPTGPIEPSDRTAGHLRIERANQASYAGSGVRDTVYRFLFPIHTAQPDEAR